MSETSLGKYRRPSKSSKLYKKVRKEYLQETILLLSLPANSDVLTHILREVQQEVIFVLDYFVKTEHFQECKSNADNPFCASLLMK